METLNQTRMLIDWTSLPVILAQGWAPEPDLLSLIRALLWFLLGWLGPLVMVGLVAYALFSLPLRRRERARLFLDLVETGLRQGSSPEQTIKEVAQCRDRSPGVRFHLLAAHLESESRLGQALPLVPRLLPPQITAMLQVGESMGDLAKVIPACRATLQDGLARGGSALHSMPLLLYLLLPAPVALLWLLPIHILPIYREIMKDMDVPPPYFFGLVFQSSWILAVVALLLMGLLTASFLVYWGGPRLSGWARPVLGPLIDSVGCRLPWRHKRFQRDFVAMLALLLEADVPENRAILMAAEATANATMLKRAARAIHDLKSGIPLPQALRHLDRRGEFRWRLANAIHGSGQFVRALAGWKEVLEARAFQQEQMAAQMLTTGFILANGVIVGLIFSGIFVFLIQMIEVGVLW